LCSLDGPVDPGTLEHKVLPALARIARPLALLVEEPSENTFPALPVRSVGHIIVWVQQTDERSMRSVLDRSIDVARNTLSGLVAEPDQLRLLPTAGSRWS
jgi:hypothetical protein